MHTYLSFSILSLACSNALYTSAAKLESGLSWNSLTSSGTASLVNSNLRGDSVFFVESGSHFCDFETGDDVGVVGVEDASESTSDKGLVASVEDESIGAAYSTYSLSRASLSSGTMAFRWTNSSRYAEALYAIYLALG